ncbi:MAG TPA: hypothetical protein VN922_19480 [Bacteroidia bacterium]|nr:hypothetical protein [Bacteroidia bacterium]
MELENLKYAISERWPLICSKCKKPCKEVFIYKTPSVRSNDIIYCSDECLQKDWPIEAQNQLKEHMKQFQKPNDKQPKKQFNQTKPTIKGGNKPVKDNEDKPTKQAKND